MLSPEQRPDSPAKVAPLQIAAGDHRSPAWEFTQDENAGYLFFRRDPDGALQSALQPFRPFALLAAIACAAVQAVLAAGLVLFLIWLPTGARASLWTGLSEQRGLVILLSIFALVTLSLVWTAGQRLDVTKAAGCCSSQISRENW